VTNAAGRAAAAAGLAALALALALAAPGILVVGVLACAVAAAPIAGLALAAVAVPFGGPWGVPVGPGVLTPAPVALAAAGVAAALPAAATGRFNWRGVWRAARPVAGPAVLFLTVLGASAWRAPDLARAVVETARWAELLLALLLAAGLTAAPARARLLIVALLAAGAAEAVVGWRTAHAGAGPEAFGLMTGASRAYGSFGQPNPFGGYMNMVWPLGVATALAWAAHGRGSWRMAALGLGCSALCLTALALSWSRGAWLGAAAAAAVMSGLWLLGALRPRPAARAAAAVWLALVAGLALVAAGPLSRAPSAVAARFAGAVQPHGSWDVRDAEVDDASFATVERLAHWQAALAMWSERPWLGQGPGHYEVAYERFRLPRWPQPLGHAHNAYLHVLAEGGLLGLAGYLAVLAGTATLAGRAALRPVTDRQRPLGLALAGVLAAVTVHGLFDWLHVHDMTIHLGLLAGLVAGAGRGSS